jgi:Holliday junction resolvase RusA-like endonuclease
MAKSSLTVAARIPNFMKDSVAWRRAIHAAVGQARDEAGIRYSTTDKLDVQIRLHLTNPKLTVLDLDNRLKDIFDALQGFMHDKGGSGECQPIIPNDNQIYRVVVEKRLAPKATRAAESRITIRRYVADERTAAEPRDTRKKAVVGNSQPHRLRPNNALEPTARY